jgi:hypothetical protein
MSSPMSSPALKAAVAGESTQATGQGVGSSRTQGVCGSAAAGSPLVRVLLLPASLPLSGAC